MLLIISVLLGFLGFLGQKQVNSIEKLGNKFSKFQIETIKSNSKFDKALEIYRLQSNERYLQEIHPTTLRSKKNEKDLVKVKTDVSKLKSIIK